MTFELLSQLSLWTKMVIIIIIMIIIIIIIIIY